MPSLKLKFKKWEKREKIVTRVATMGEKMLPEKGKETQGLFIVHHYHLRIDNISRLKLID